MPQLFAGTSGFAYSTWKPGFYPREVPARNFLAYYAQRLNCVEINYTFHRLPAAATIRNWLELTGPGFVFALKAPMRITHVLRLRDAGAALEAFLAAVDPLRIARRLGPVLFQLPPQLRVDAQLLASFLELLPPGLRYAFEFRHASWLDEGIYGQLAARNISLCVAESEKMEIPEVLTADFVYYRLRKPDYSASDVDAIVARSRQLLAQGRDVYLIFKHEETPEGALHAERVLRS
ncbi:MAG: DUF72 domain-containing protein [Acidobacteria bacterium]|nr:DUF72 domain-containing protein [Acidobacteriota bacterium]